ncbi:MAG: hypothetical protein Q9169_007885 [Polycauliona sp. 2 TL-2023]
MSQYLSQGSFAKDMSSVKGLYVGMNLLNELEPLQTHPNTEFFSKHYEIMEYMTSDNRLVDLSGTPMGCTDRPIPDAPSSDILDAPSNSIPRAPSSDIPDAPLQGIPQPPLIDTLSVSSNWSEARQDFLDLQGRILSEPTSFQKYLEQLVPSPSGNGVCCPTCWDYSHDGFPLGSVESHFRVHHLDSDVSFIDKCAYKPNFDNLIRSLKEKPEASAAVIHLRGQCALQRTLPERVMQRGQAKKYDKTQLPSVCIAIFHLVACCDGQLVCRHKKCQGLTRFDSSVEAITSHFTEVHCAHLTNINYMGDAEYSSFQLDVRLEFSPDKTAWIIDPLLAEADKRKFEWDLSNPWQRSKAMDRDQRQIKRMRLLHDYVRQRRQWTVLQELRAAFASRNQCLLRLISESSSIKLQVLGRYDSLDLLDTGILILEDLLRGTSPDSLKEVLAFLHLSHSAAIVMRNHGTPNSFSPTAKDFALWRHGVPQQQRPLFDEVIHLMYPDLRDRYDYYVSMTEPLHPGEAADYFHGLAADMLKDFERHQDFDFSCFDDTFLQFVNTEAYGGGPPEENRSRERPLKTSTYAHFQPLNDHQPSYTNKARRPALATPHKLLNFVERLRTTDIFLMVIHFVTCRLSSSLLKSSNRSLIATDVSQLGFLLWKLGKMIDNRSPDGSLSVKSSAATSRSSRFADVLRFRVAGPLSLDVDLSELRPLVIIAVKMVEIGWLMSLRAFEGFMITMVSHFPVSKHVFASLVEKTLTCCSAAATTLDPEYLGGTDSDSCNDYDSIFVRSRQEHHLKVFLRGGHDQQASDAGSQNSDETLTDDLDFNMTTNNMPSPVEEDIDFNTFIQNLGTTSNSTLPSFDFGLVPDLPNASASFHASSTPNPPSTIHPTTQTPSPTKQHKSCTVPGCSKVFTGVESTNNLRRHKREKHCNRSSWSCPFENCDLVSSRLHNIRQHWLKKHIGAPLPEELMPKRAKGGGGLSRRVTAVLPIV